MQLDEGHIVTVALGHIYIYIYPMLCFSISNELNFAFQLYVHVYMVYNTSFSTQKKIMILEHLMFSTQKVMKKNHIQFCLLVIVVTIVNLEHLQSKDYHYAAPIISFTLQGHIIDYQTWSSDALWEQIVLGLESSSL